MPSITMDKICKGCKEHERHIEDPDVYTECEGFIEEDIECPCINCLVKMVCESPCSLFRKRPWIKTKEPHYE